jgi:hypothetical protein
MSRKAILWGQAASVLILLVTVGSTRAEDAADDCLSKPNGTSPAGSHWYYRLERGTHRQCWYLGPEGGRVHQAQPRRPAASHPARQAETSKPPLQQEDSSNGSDARSKPATNASTSSTPAGAARTGSAVSTGGAAAGGAVAEAPVSSPPALPAPLLAPRPLLQLSDALSSQGTDEPDSTGRPAAVGAPERPVGPSSYGEDQNTTDLEEQEEMPLVWPVMAASELEDGDTHEPPARSSGALAFITGSLAASFGGMLLWALYLVFAKEPTRRHDDHEWSRSQPSYRQRPEHWRDARSFGTERPTALDRGLSGWARLWNDSAQFASGWATAALRDVRRSWSTVRTSVGNAILPASLPPELPHPPSRSTAESIGRRTQRGYPAQATPRAYQEPTAAEQLVRAARLARGKPPEASAPALRRRAPSIDSSDEPLRLPDWMSARRRYPSRV